MRILFVCHRLPFPPKRGGKIRPFNIIRHLAESGHSVTVGSLARSDQEFQDGQGLTDFCHKLLVGHVGKIGPTVRMIGRLPTTIPSSMGYFYSPDLYRAIRTELQRQKFDLIFVHCSSVAQYVPTSNEIHSILDFGDMDSQKWLDYATFRKFPLALGYWLEGTKLCREEKRLARRFTMSTCTTHAELETLRSYNAAPTSGWFPNGVDADFFSPSERPYDPNQICFIGRMDYYPNQQAMLDFCAHVLPLIQARRPATKLTIVGAEPSVEIKKLAEKQGVTVTGTVPDVRDYVRSSALSVAPLSIARGTQNKILESMAMAVPVVCSEIAGGGVDATIEEHILSASSPTEFARQVIRLLESTTERDRFAVAARERVLTNHNWSTSMRKMDEIINGLKGEAA